MKNKMKVDEVSFKPLEVIPRPDESFEKVLKRFTKKVKNEGNLTDYINKSYFVKPGAKRRAKKLKSIWNCKKSEQEKRKKF